jgi:hypothetical protein
MVAYPLELVLADRYPFSLFTPGQIFRGAPAIGRYVSFDRTETLFETNQEPADDSTGTTSSSWITRFPEGPL